MPTPSAQSQAFAWLVRLRWAAVAGHALTILAVDRGLGIELPMTALFAVVAFEALTNVVATMWQVRGRPVTAFGLTSIMALDVVLLTTLLYLSGGPFNPFSFLYLVHIALAAVMLSEKHTWALVVLSLGASGLLFVRHRPLPLPPGSTHDDHMRIHLQGMWVAFGVAAAFIVWFLLRVLRALAQRDDELMRARAQKDRLASLATLAGGAAHELATPLSTILVVTRELERKLSSGPELDDVRLVRQQVERCRAILDGMTAQAGERAGETLVAIELDELARLAVDGLPAKPVVEVAIERGGGEPARGPVRALAQAFRVLIKNAQDASPDDHPVVLALRQDAQGLAAEVRDRGTGIAPDVLAHLGEPFFTTKAPGKGMGLGFFLTRTVVEQLGGSLDITTEVGRGTTIAVRVPRHAALRQDAALTAGGPGPDPLRRG